MKVTNNPCVHLSIKLSSFGQIRSKINKIGNKRLIFRKL